MVKPPWQLLFTEARVLRECRGLAPNHLAGIPILIMSGRNGSLAGRFLQAASDGQKLTHSAGGKSDILSQYDILSPRRHYVARDDILSSGPDFGRGPGPDAIRTNGPIGGAPALVP